MESVKQQYPKLCSGLGLVRRPYSIKLKPEAVLFSLHAPRRIPLPLLGKVKEEIDRMEKMGVITKIEEPTNWCAGMVVVPKKAGTVQENMTILLQFYSLCTGYLLSFVSVTKYYYLPIRP